MAETLGNQTYPDQNQEVGGVAAWVPIEDRKPSTEPAPEGGVGAAIASALEYAATKDGGVNAMPAQQQETGGVTSWKPLPKRGGASPDNQSSVTGQPGGVVGWKTIK